MTAPPPTMRHRFAGDPWGRCSGCGHPNYHEIHWTAEDQAELEEAERIIERMKEREGEP